MWILCRTTNVQVRWWLDKQRAVDLTFSHVRLTTVDTLTCYLFTYCVSCSTLWCLGSWTNSPFSRIKGLSDLVSLNVCYFAGNHTKKQGTLLFNEFIQTKLNTKSYETAYSGTFMPLGSVGLDGYRQYIQNDLASCNAFTFKLHSVLIMQNRVENVYNHYRHPTL